MEHAHVTLQEFSLPHQARYQINVSLTSSEPQHGHLMAEQYPEIKINIPIQLMFAAINILLAQLKKLEITLIIENLKGNYTQHKNNSPDGK